MLTVSTPCSYTGSRAASTGCSKIGRATRRRMIDWVRIGAAIRRSRDLAGLSQQALADRAGVSHALVGFLETARRDNYYVKSLLQICEALGLDLTLAVGAEKAAPELERLVGLARQVDPKDLQFATEFLERCVQAKAARSAS